MEKFIVTVSVFSLFCVPTLAAAQEQAMSMAEMQKQLEALSSQVQTLSEVVQQQNQVIKAQDAAIKQQKTQPLPSQNTQSVAPATSDDVKVSLSPSPKIESADGKYSFEAFGRVHMDATLFDDDKSDNASGTDIRRARIGVEGNLGESLEYKTQIDFAGDDTDIKDMTLTYTGSDVANVTVGHHRSPVGLENNTSSNQITFIERAGATNAFAPGRKIGASLATKYENHMFGVGVFNEEAGNSSTGDDEDVSIDARGSVNLLGLFSDEQEDVFHVGLGYNYLNPTGDIQYSARPGVGDGPSYIDTGAISDADDVSLIVAEFASVFGPLSVQGEYFYNDVNRQSADAHFDGYYAQASYFLTNDMRPYDGTSGTFDAVTPHQSVNLNQGHWGAWELVARYDHTDLNDSSAGISGGELDLYTLGLNWYVNDNVRLMGNVIQVDSDENAATAPNDDPTIFNMRAQWVF